MSDENQLVLTEELLKEFLDPVTAKAYTWKQETESGYASLKFQASFQDEHEKIYYLSFYRDSSFGKNSRRVIFSVKKNKNLNPKINVDKGSFIKILGTIIQIYQYYKENDSDGKMSNSYGFQFPDSFAKYMPFVYKVIKRLFKTNPKIRLDLFGAIDSLDNATIMYYVNSSSHMPHFGGPKADLSIIRGPFYTSITGETAAAVADGEKASIASTPDVAAVKLDIKPKTAAVKKVAKAKAPVAPTPEVVAEPKTEGWVEPDFDNTQFGAYPMAPNPNRIKMKVPSSSSSLPAGKEAICVGVYNFEKFKNCYKQFNINDNAVFKLGKMYVLVVMPVATVGKYVALDANINDLLKSNDRWDYEGIPKAESPKVVTPVVPKPQATDFNYIPQNKNAKSFEIPQTLKDSLKQLPTIELGPVKISLNEDDVSVIGIAEKLQEIKTFFGTLPKDQLNDTIANMLSVSSKAQTKVSDIINRYLSDNSLFFGTGWGEATPDSIKAIKMYSGSWYGSINNYLRSGVDSEGNTAKRVADIDGAFTTEGIRFPSDLTVYRGASISAEQIKALQKLDIIPLTGYASVSLRARIGVSFASVGGYTSDIIRGALVSFEDESDRENLGTAEIHSKQGNKILYSINRLDRCLSLAIRKVSQHEDEDEILLNRGTNIKLRKGAKIQKVLNRYNPYGENITEDDGVWIAKVEIAPMAVSESNLRLYLLREAVVKFSEVQDAVALTNFFLEDCLQTVSK